MHPAPPDARPVSMVSVVGCTLASMADTTCLVAGCTGTRMLAAPVVLCAVHTEDVLAQSISRSPIEDVLDSPCLACGARLGVRYPSGAMCAVCEWRVGDVPDGSLPPPRVDVVYYLGYADRVKIGTTANPRQRLSSLRHDVLLAFERGDRSRERMRHAQFAALRLERTEWFRASPELDAHIEVLRGGVEDPWLLHRRWVSEAWATRA